MSKTWGKRNSSKSRKGRKSTISPEEIDELMRKGAESARELGKQLQFMGHLPAASRNLVLR